MNAVKEPGLLDAEEEDQILSPEDESSCQKYLIFVIDNLRLGVDVKYVVEILNNHSDHLSSDDAGLHTRHLQYAGSDYSSIGYPAAAGQGSERG
mgnify:CR=1 FL=1